MFKLISAYMQAHPDRFHFTYQDKRDCFEIISKLLDISQRAKRIGKLNLEEDAYDAKNFFFKKALYLYIDNVDIDIAIDILETYIVYGDYERSGLFEKLVIIEGIKSFYMNEITRITEERLLAYVGEGLQAEFEEFRSKTSRLEIPGVGVAQLEEREDPNSFTYRRKKFEEQHVDTGGILSQDDIDKLLSSLLEDY